jgi:hypothetical protein
MYTTGAAGLTFSGGTVIGLANWSIYILFMSTATVSATYGYSLYGENATSGNDFISLKAWRQSGPAITGLFVNDRNDASSQDYIASTAAINTGHVNMALAIKQNLNCTIISDVSGYLTPTTGTFSYYTPMTATAFNTSISGSFPGYMYQTLVWRRALATHLAEELYRDPTALWWWPGKTGRRVFIMHSSGAYLPWRTGARVVVGAPFGGMRLR